MGFLEDQIDENLRVQREFEKKAPKEVKAYIYLPADTPMGLVDLAEEVIREVHRSTTLHGTTNSVHEALGIMDEEYDEFKREVYAYNPNKGRDTKPKMHTELIHMAAVALKAIYCLKMPKENK
jgi:hypothetical protein